LSPLWPRTLPGHWSAPNSALPGALAKLFLATVLALATAGCGYDASATFKADGSVTVGLKFLVPQSLLQGPNGPAVSGLSPADIAAASARLEAKYPGARARATTDGEESGAQVTIPFKTEADAFAFLTAPTQLTVPQATSGSGFGLNLSSTGGLFVSALHTSSGQIETYSFTTAPVARPSPSPGAQQIITGDELAAIFRVTFSLTVPQVIRSAPGALFTLDRKTATWKLSWTEEQTLTATTGPEVGPVVSVSPAPSWRLLVSDGLVAIALGFVLGMLVPWRRQRKPAPPPGEPPGTSAPAVPAP
jgi:hypothetical protein